MASATTLTSLAMLKVRIDHGRDYLEYLRPFILQVLADHKPSPITDQLVTDHLRTDYGLAVPSRAVQILLRRIARTGALKKAENVFEIAGDLPDPGIARKKAEADRHISAIVSGLCDFRRGYSSASLSADEAVTALCEFLSEFSIPCLRAYLRGTAIPDIPERQHGRIVLVSQYVFRLQKNDPDRFESFMVLVQGHMLANGLLCPDLQSAPRSYKGVTFYLDTPLLVQRLGLEGSARRDATAEMINLLQGLGGTIATFSHSREELDKVIKGAADHVDSPYGRGAVVFEARRNGISKSDLLLLAAQADDHLSQASIRVKSTPPYTKDFQIDERVFEEVLDDEVSYYNPGARQYDINSVRSIYALRKGHIPQTLEKCAAVLVTSNSAFSRAAFQYGRQYEESREVSSVITDFSLANMAWLKAPMGAPSLPAIEILAYAYAALRPSKVFLDKYLQEIEKLEQCGTISERDHQLLRSSTLAQEELMLLTLGEESALTEQTISETLDRVTKEIKQEEAEKLREERAAHGRTQKQLTATRAEKEALQKHIFWKCRKKASRCAGVLAGLLAVLLLVGIVVGLGFRTTSPVAGWACLLAAAGLGVMTLTNLYWGITVRHLYRAIERRCLTHFLRREAQAIGIDLGTPD